MREHESVPSKSAESTPQKSQLPDSSARLYEKYAGLDRSAASVWWEKDIGPYDAGRYVKQQVTPEQVTARRVQHQREQDAVRRREWELGAPQRFEELRRAEAERSQRRSQYPKQCHSLAARHSGVISAAESWEEPNHSPKVVAEWARVGIPELVIDEALRNELTPELLSGLELGTLSIDERAAVVFGKSAGVTRDSLKPWLDCDLTKAQLISAVQFTEVSEQDVRQWVDSGRPASGLLEELSSGASYQHIADGF
jgi:hypothetical protein